MPQARRLRLPRVGSRLQVNRPCFPLPCNNGPPQNLCSVSVAVAGSPGDELIRADEDQSCPISLAPGIAGIPDDLEGQAQLFGGFFEGLQGPFIDVQAQERKALTEILIDVAT